MLQTIVKQPSEAIKAALPFDGGAVVSALLDVVVAARGLVPAATPLQAVGTLFAGAVHLDISAGDDGERYLVTGRAEMADGATREAEVEIVVIDAAWTMPDGGAPMLTIDEFVLRFGLPEVVTMTDDGTGRIDRDYLVGKLTDAQALTEAHLAGRYALPLAAPSLLVKMIIADLACARLYRGAMPDGVESAAKVAMRNLERIQSGQLLIAAAGALPEAPAIDPVVVTPGDRAYPDKLAGY